MRFLEGFSPLVFSRPQNPPNESQPQARRSLCVRVLAWVPDAKSNHATQLTFFEVTPAASGIPQPADVLKGGRGKKKREKVRASRLTKNTTVKCKDICRAESLEEKKNTEWSCSGSSWPLLLGRKRDADAVRLLSLLSWLQTSSTVYYRTECDLLLILGFKLKLLGTLCDALSRMLAARHASRLLSRSHTWKICRHGPCSLRVLRSVECEASKVSSVVRLGGLAFSEINGQKKRRGSSVPARLCPEPNPTQANRAQG